MNPSRLTAVVLLALCLVVGGCSRDEVQADSDPPPPRVGRVDVLVLQPRAFTEQITTYGVFEAAEEVALAVDFAARVVAVHFDAGSRVEAGQLLVEFDARERGLQVRRARAAVAAAQAELEDAGQVLERMQALATGGMEAGAKLDSARFVERRAAAQAEDAVAALALAEHALGKVRLVSPVTGVIESRSVDPGETPSAGAVLGVIEAVGAIRTVTYVSEKDINQLRVGSPVTVRTPGVRGHAFAARIESVGIKADSRTGNFQVKLTLPNPDGLLRPGMTARADLPGMRIESAILIPDAALVDRDRRKVAFKLVEGHAVMVEPVLMPVSAGQIPVISGLVAGDQLIVSGLQHVVDGSPVRLREEPR